MNKKRILFLLKLFLILILTGNIATEAQNGEARKSGCGGSNSKTKTNAPKSEVNASNPAAVGGLEGRRWNLIEINGARVESSKAFIEFVSAEKRFAGNAGCNRMFGKYETSGERIKFSDTGTTRMFCSEEGVMQRESDFIKALEQTTRFELAGDTLNLFAGNNLVLKFSAVPENKTGNKNPGGFNLEDKKWILTQIGGKALPKIKAAPFLVFDKQKASAGGDTGCNSFGGGYKTEGNKISFVEIVSTLRACIEDERMNVEREFLGGLRKANRFEIKAGKLNLYEGDALLLTFDAQEKN